MISYLENTKSIFQLVILEFDTNNIEIKNKKLSIKKKVQSAFNYALLSFICIPVWIITLYKQKLNFKEVFKNRAWKYFLLSIADVEANYFMVKAYSMTIITTIQVLQNINVIFHADMCILKKRYRVAIPEKYWMAVHENSGHTCLISCS